MHAGKLSRAQIQGWVINRFYYQTRIPIKDAIIVSKSEDPDFRRRWLRRIRDHDGVEAGEGGLALWLRLAQGVGLDPVQVQGASRVLPAVRFACDAYVQLVRERSLVEAVAASLTELFSPEIMTRRLAAWAEYYPWVDGNVQEYLRRRVRCARRDAQEALEFVLSHADTRAVQERCLEAFITKCQVLWSLLDAVDQGYPE
jgi:pyrroloquinoline-quinone synthase